MKAPALDTQTRLQLQYDADKKLCLIAYLLWFGVGMFGAHRFYLNQKGSAIAILILSVIGVVSTVFFVGLVILLVPAIWLFVDLFLIPGMVRDFNKGLISRMSGV